MRQLAIGLCSCLVVTGVVVTRAWAQGTPSGDASGGAAATATAGEEPATGTPAPVPDEPVEPAPPVSGGTAATAPAPEATAVKAPDVPAAKPPLSPEEARRRAWGDVVVVPRRAVRKYHRLELAPLFGVTINDNLIHHFGFGGMATFYLTEVLALGLEGQYFVSQLTDRYNLIPLEYRRLPTVNKYIWHAALDFSYVPIYGKFALFNRAIIHWEIYVIAGVGVTQTEVIPRNPADRGFTNYNITPNVGIGGRIFFNRWLAMHIGLRDYIFNDRFEPEDRTPGMSMDEVESKAPSEIINNLQFHIGVSIFLPPSFKYTTLR
jgi:outer membrane beta-barrel protein